MCLGINYPSESRPNGGVRIGGGKNSLGNREGGIILQHRVAVRQLAKLHVDGKIAAA